jgi:hypothetical protein
MLQLAPRGEIAVPMLELEDLCLPDVKAGGSVRVAWPLLSPYHPDKKRLSDLPGRSAAQSAWLENVLPARHYVCFGSLADIGEGSSHVRLHPNSGHAQCRN